MADLSDMTREHHRALAEGIALARAEDLGPDDLDLRLDSVLVLYGIDDRGGLWPLNYIKLAGRTPYPSGQYALSIIGQSDQLSILPSGPLTLTPQSDAPVQASDRQSNTGGSPGRGEVSVGPESVTVFFATGQTKLCSDTFFPLSD